mmetsp:Transcript_14456/g.20810  ORF Transcript_14456/g.20810 Transcript_14456/m.20810 type:complete len:259 (+) Transcript_14456:44-820(+)
MSASSPSSSPSPSTTTSPTPTPTTRLASMLPPLADNARRVYILRHGQTDWNLEGRMQGGGFDIELNENGRQQARMVSKELAGIPIGVIASSHLKRANETANIVLREQQQQQLKLQQAAKRVVLEEFGEMRFGNLEGMIIRGLQLTDKTKQIMMDMDAVELDITARYPGGGESTEEVETRARRGLQKILNDYPDEKHLAIVAHGRTNKILLASLVYNDALRCREIPQGNTCINVVDQDQHGKWTCRILNFLEHNHYLLR